MYIPDSPYATGYRDNTLYIWLPRGDKHIVFGRFICVDGEAKEEELSPWYVECTEEEAKLSSGSVFMYKDQFLNPTPSWWRIANASSDENALVLASSASQPSAV